MTNSQVRTLVPVSFPGIGSVDGSDPIVVIGPNGVGKSRLMRRVAGEPARFISAQRRTYLEEQIPTSRSDQAKSQMNSQLHQAHSNPWMWSNEIDFLFGRILQEHYAALDSNNEAAKVGGSSTVAVADTAMDRLKAFWQAVFVNRRLSFRDFSPTAERTDRTGESPYPAKTMSDGERTCLYLAARVLTADPGLLVIDEPELHLHRKLCIDYWDNLEAMRPDIRFVYVTHDLHFALSRRDPTLLVVLDEGRVQIASTSALPSDLTEALLGAATLTTNAKRIVFFEGVTGKGLADDLFKRWIRKGTSAAFGLGSRSSVLNAGAGFSQLGIVSNAQVVAVVDRDHGPEALLADLKRPAFVLELHEIESLFALPVIVRAIARHFAYQGPDAWAEFLRRARQDIEQSLPKMVSERVRARIGMLLNGAFDHSQIRVSLAETAESHAMALGQKLAASSVRTMFTEEEAWIRRQMSRDDHGILIAMSGKQALSLAANVVGVGRDTYSNLVLKAIEDPKHALHAELVAEFEKYLPSRE